MDDSEHAGIHNPRAMTYCALRAALALAEEEERDRERLQKQLAELVGGDGVYYITQERAFAPGIADGWPEVIAAPHTHNGRLVRRQISDAARAAGSKPDAE
jgi:hypothetical protein